MSETDEAMDDKDPAAWRAQLIAAVKKSAGRPSSTGDRRELWGKAEPAPERGAGWYRLFGALADKDLDRMNDAVLMFEGDDLEHQFAVLDVLVEEGSAYVRVQNSSALGEMSLYLTKMDRRRRFERLAEGLAKAAPDHRAFGCFATGRLDPIVDQPDDISPFPRGKQRQAFDACLSPGLQIVWGPPGTGKTHVIVAALDHLARVGQRCLLVSTTNIAVDNALVRLLESGTFADGTIVRVGLPRLPELRTRDDVLFAGLVASALTIAAQPVDELEARLAALESAGAEARLTAAQDRLDSFDNSRYRAARTRLHDAACLLEAQRGLRAEQLRLSDLEDQLTALERFAAACRYTVAVLEERAALAWEKQLREAREALQPWSWLKRKSIEHTRELAFTKARSAFEETAESERVAVSLGVDPLPDVGEDRVLADERATARQVSNELNDVFDRTNAQRHQILRATAERDRLSTRPVPRAEDRGVCEAAENASFPELLASLPRLEKEATVERPALEALRSELEEARRTFEDERSKVEREVLGKACVVATTLTQLVLRPVVSATAYDVVLVDEAAAAILPEVVLAATQATYGTTLLGDYLQNGPIVDRDLTSEYWTTEVFERFKLSSPVSATSTPGCAVLTEQRRFGPAVADLVNKFAYQNVLTTKGEHESEVVVVDVDGLPEALTHIEREPGRRAGTWAVGALLSRALAEHHLELGETVGVVVPFKGQKNATEAAMLESAVTAGVEVGTAHSFQGREFDTVIFDMVEDGGGWMAKADVQGTDFARNGARLANVALTRSRHRVYVLVHGRALKTDKNQQRPTPLGALARMLAADEVSCLRASAVLELEEVPTAAATGVQDFWLALAPYARIDGLYDEVTLPPRLIQLIAAARRDVWLWSAWVGSFTQELQDALASAAAAGVEVTVMVRPPNEVTDQIKENIAALRRRTSVVLLEHMHQKLAIIDNQTVFIGSMNVLSAAARPAGRSLERSLEAHSAPLARQILEAERAYSYRNPPRCATCKEYFFRVRTTTRGETRTRSWVCQTPACSGSAALIPAP